MKILALTPFFLPYMGGIEILVANLAGKLRQRGIEVIVATDSLGGFPEHEVMDGVDVFRFELINSIRSGNAGNILSILGQVQALMARENADLIHLHSTTQAWAFYLDRLRRKQALGATRPLVITQHGVLTEEDKLGVVRKLLVEADMLTGVSDAALNSALVFSGRQAPSTRIYNGVEIPDDDEPHGAHDAHRLLCVGRLQREKGFDLAIGALAFVRSEGLDIYLDIVGGGENGAEFEALARSLGVAKHVTFHGPLDHATTLDIMRKARLLLAPSRTREGFALVVVEAAIAGTPAVVSDVGGLPETVSNGQTGRIVPRENMPALAGAVLEILRDDDTWQRMSQQARSRARAEFDILVCTEKYAKLYRDILS